jgi:hypothetical protein
MTTLFCKIHPVLPFPKEGIIPLFGKEGQGGDFLNNINSIMRLLISYPRTNLAKEKTSANPIGLYRILICPMYPIRSAFC